MLLALLAVVHATPADTAPVYDGRQQALTVQVPRLDGPVVIDGGPGRDGLEQRGRADRLLPFPAD